MANSALITASLEHEQKLVAQGFVCIAGLDEAGRGAWAGPVVAAAVILPPNRDNLLNALEGVNDSKKLSAKRRAALFPRIQEIALGWGVGRATSREIDDKGIITATRWAMERALRKLSCEPDYLLIDALRLDGDVMPEDRQLALVKGDQAALSIAAASILAKVSRDEFMVALDEQYPEYGFAQHKGYGTKQHQSMLTTHGPCQAHRYSFKPVRAVADRSS